MLTILVLVRVSELRVYVKANSGNYIGNKSEVRGYQAQTICVERIRKVFV